MNELTMDELLAMDKLMTTVPTYIKLWYIADGKKYGRKMQPHASFALTQYAIANGAKPPEEDNTTKEDKQKENTAPKKDEFKYGEDDYRIK